MKQEFYTSVLVLSIMLSTCIFAGCSDDKADGSKGAKKIKFSTVDTSSWPNDLPKFKDGKLFQVINNSSGVLAAAVFSNIKNPETAYKNYKKSLINSGWVLESESPNEFNWTGSFEKGLNTVRIIIQKDGSTAQLFCTRDYSN